MPQRAGWGWEGAPGEQGHRCRAAGCCVGAVCAAAAVVFLLAVIDDGSPGRALVECRSRLRSQRAGSVSTSSARLPSSLLSSFFRYCDKTTGLPGLNPKPAPQGPMSEDWVPSSLALFWRYWNP